MCAESPLVSVVVPTYNRARLICDSLDSVNAQSFRPIELLVIDDGSTDDTEAVVADWACLHEDPGLSVRYIRQENCGGNPARNRGIREASGKYVAFLDSDDRWHPQKLEKQMDALLADRNAGAVYCGLQHWFADEDRIEPPAPRDYPSGHILGRMLIQDVTAPTSCYLVRGSVFDDIGLFDEDLQARQDWDMWIRVASVYHIASVPEVLVDYREHSGVRTASNPQKEINAYRMIMQKYESLRAASSWRIRRAAAASFYRRMGRVYFHHRLSVPKAFGYQLLSILNWPFVFDSYAALFGMLLPANGRQTLHRAWNRLFGASSLAIKSH